MRWTLVFACVLFASSCKREIELVELPGTTDKAEKIVLRGEVTVGPFLGSSNRCYYQYD